MRLSLYWDFFCIRCFRNFRARLLALFSSGRRSFALLFPLRLRSHLSSVSASVSASPSSILCIFATATATCHHDGRSRRPFCYHLRPGCPSQVLGFHPHRIWLPALPLWPFDPARRGSFHALQGRARGARPAKARPSRVSRRPVVAVRRSCPGIDKQAIMLTEE